MPERHDEQERAVERDSKVASDQRCSGRSGRTDLPNLTVSLGDLVVEGVQMGSQGS